MLFKKYNPEVYHFFFSLLFNVERGIWRHISGTQVDCKWFQYKQTSEAFHKYDYTFRRPTTSPGILLL